MAIKIEEFDTPEYVSKRRQVYPWAECEQRFSNRTNNKAVGFPVDAEPAGEKRKKLSAALSSRNRTLKAKPFVWRWMPEGAGARVWLENRAA
jgi:hypothetical protein